MAPIQNIFGIYETKHATISDSFSSYRKKKENIFLKFATLFQKNCLFMLYQIFLTYSKKKIT